MAIPSRVKNPVTGQMIPLSSTPGGSIFGTTPGGTRIQYDRHSLLGYKNSPLSKSPAFLPQSIISAGVTTESAVPIKEEILRESAGASSGGAAGAAAPSNDGGDDEELFEME